MKSGIVEEFGLLWQSGPSPDVFAFLSEHPQATDADILAVVLRDQKCRWATDDPIKVEGYIAQIPWMATDPQAKLELAIGGYRARLNSETGAVRIASKDCSLTKIETRGKHGTRCVHRRTYNTVQISTTINQSSRPHADQPWHGFCSF